MQRKEIELTDRMAERADELDNAVYDMLITLLQLEGEEIDREFPWNITIIREILDYTISVLEREGKSVCNPYITHTGKQDYLCTLSECGCSKCGCQDEFMEQERIMGRIDEAMSINGLEITGTDENRIMVKEPRTKESFEIVFRKIKDEVVRDGKREKL